MALVLCNQGEQRMLEKFFADDMVLHLFSNDYTPVEASTEANLTEVSGYGYSSKSLVGGSWSVTPGAPSAAEYAKQTFSFTGAAGDVYGYYVTAADDSKLLFAERFTGAPFNVARNGDKIEVTPNFTQD